MTLTAAHIDPPVEDPVSNVLKWVLLVVAYGTDKIRGHGIPEAIEAIPLGRSRLDLKVTILKPLSSAIAIGTGGPFGAEGPNIMTGGAVGSLTAQMLPVTDTERKTLLVAGAAAGMTTVFGTPLAAACSLSNCCCSSGRHAASSRSPRRRSSRKWSAPSSVCPRRSFLFTAAWRSRSSGLAHRYSSACLPAFSRAYLLSSYAFVRTAF